MNKNAIVLLIFSLTFVVVCSLDMYLPIAPQLADVFKVSPHMIKLNFMLGPLTAGLIGIPIGHFSDCYGRRPLMFLSLVFFLFGFIFCARSESIEMFYFGRFLGSLGVGGLLVLCSAILSDLFKGAELARYIGLFALIFPIAFASAPVIGAQVYVWLGWRAIFWGLFIVSIPIALGIAFYMSETCRKEGKSSMLSLMWKMSTSKLGLALALTHAVPVTIGAIFTVNGSFLYYNVFHFDSVSFSFVQATPVFAQCLGTLLYRRVVHATGPKQTLKMGSWVAGLYSIVCLLMIFNVFAGPWVSVLAVCLFSLGGTFVIISAATLLLDCSEYNKGFISSFLSLVKNIVIAVVIAATSFLPSHSVVPIFSAMFFVSLLTVLLVFSSLQALEKQKALSLNS